MRRRTPYPCRSAEEILTGVGAQKGGTGYSMWTWIREIEGETVGEEGVGVRYSEPRAVRCHDPWWGGIGDRRSCQQMRLPSLRGPFERTRCEAVLKGVGGRGKHEENKKSYWHLFEVHGIKTILEAFKVRWSCVLGSASFIH
eukprot:768221-Hanusia_phi.AAC.8